MYVIHLLSKIVYSLNANGEKKRGRERERKSEREREREREREMTNTSINYGNYKLSPIMLPQNARLIPVSTS